MPLKYKIYFFVLLSHNVFSQNFLGIAGSNYSGTNSLATNPANVVDTRQRIFINLAGAGIDFQNNYVRWNAPFSLLSFVTRTTPNKYRNADGSKVIWKPSYLKVSESGRDLSIYANGEAKGPAIGVDIKKWGLGIALGVRYRFMNSLTQASDEIGKIIIKGTKTTELIGNTYVNEHGYLNSSFINEFYGSIGKVIVEEESKFIKIGATGKYYVSSMYNHIGSKNFDFTIVPNLNDNLRQDIDIKNAQATLTDASSFNSLQTSNFTGQLTELTGIGKGFGGDLGIIYEYRPDFQTYTRNNNRKQFTNPTQNKYLYKIGFSLIDVGFIKFSNGVETNALFSSNDVILPQTYQKFGGFEPVIATTNSIFGTASANSNSFIILMPATSVFTFDYNLKENIYINLNWRQSLLNSDRRGIINYSGVSITPRYEKKSLEIAVPIGIENNYKNLNVGAAFRYYGFYFGSDNITGWLNTFNPRGVSVYAGAFIPIYHSLPGSPLKCFVVANPQSYRKKKFRRR
jgi:hypothetical protein